MSGKSIIQRPVNAIEHVSIRPVIAQLGRNVQARAALRLHHVT
jgi:hypothetical protein